MLKVEDWAEIRRLHFSEGLGIKTIAARFGVSRNTVRSAVRSTTPPRYERAPAGSRVDEFEPAIRQLLQTDPRMPATVIAERIDWPGGMTVLKDRVRELRPLFVPVDPSQRTHYRPGEVGQWDLWFPAVDIPLGYGQTGRLPVIVGVSGFSRVITARMIPSRETHDVLGGHLACLLDLGGVPREGVYDGEAAIGRRRGERIEFTAAFQAFRGVLGMGAYICRPRDPEAKGLVERAIRYLETSFLPGRTFEDVEGFNAQLAAWVESKANRRVHATLRCRPTDRLAEDRGAMLALPPVLPDVAWRHSLRLPRDHYVRVATNDYSVHPSAIGRRVDITADLDWVVVTCAGTEVARHRRTLTRHRTITDAAHGRAARLLREAATAPPPAQVEVEERDLAVYDQTLGVA